eukprot:gene17430-biopygen18883
MAAAAVSAPPPSHSSALRRKTAPRLLWRDGAGRFVRGVQPADTLQQYPLFPLQCSVCSFILQVTPAPDPPRV